MMSLPDLSPALDFPKPRLPICLALALKYVKNTVGAKKIHGFIQIP